MSGDMPAGVNMAQITAMNQSAGRTAGAQMWLGGWLPVLDYKPGITPIGEIVPFFQKQCMPGAGIMKFLCMPEGHLAKLLKEVFAGGFNIEDFAADLSPEDLKAVMEARASGIEEGLDAGHMKSLLGNMALQNVAMTQQMLSQGNGQGRG